MEQVRVGFIGAGGIANRHLEVLRGFHEVKITAISDPTLERALTLARRVGAKAYEQYETMLESETLDAVFICVPPFAHGVIEHAVLDMKLPFFIEKPLGVDWETASAVGARVAAQGTITGVGYQWRYLSTVDRAQHLLRERPARLMLGYWLDQTPPPEWWRREDQSGGQIVEQTTHIFDLARYLMGEVDSVFAVGAHLEREQFPDSTILETTTATLRFASGALGNITSTCLLNWGHRVGMHLFSEGQAIEISQHDMMVDHGHGRPMDGQQGDPVVRQDRDFIDTILGIGDHVRSKYADSLKTHRLTLAANQSAREGREISLRPVEAALAIDAASPEPAHKRTRKEKLGV